MTSGAHSLVRKAIRGYLEKRRVLEASKPTVSGIGFYLPMHKDLGAAEVGILSTQRLSRGRGSILSTPMFYATGFKYNL